MTLPTEIEALRSPLLQGLRQLGWAAASSIEQPQHDPNSPPGDRALALPTSAPEQLLAYLALLHKWNKAYNLTSVRNPQDMLSLHLLDCLATIPLIEERLGGPPSELIDVGSGGGLPGIVYAIAWPECEIHLVDTVGKKAAFLNQCKLQLKLPHLQAHHQRIEQLKLGTNTGKNPGKNTATTTGDTKPRVFTCRAFATLNAFVSQTWHLRQTASEWFALKGQWPTQELDELTQKTQPALNTAFQVTGIEVHPPGLEDAQRHLVCIKTTETV